MSIAPEQRVYTPEDLLSMPDSNDFELVDGQLVERNTGGESVLVATRINRRIGAFAESNNLGEVFQSDLGYRCFAEDPMRIRKPDGSFIRRGRYTREQLAEGYMRVVSDLAIEVVSPNDLSLELDVKVEEYLAEGVRLVWVLNPETKIVAVHRLDGTVSKLHAQDNLSGEDVLPGFACRVAELFQVSGT